MGKFEVFVYIFAIIIGVSNNFVLIASIGVIGLLLMIALRKKKI
jgi:hypothetical protein